MSVKERLKEDMKTAMKSRDALRLSAIRMVNSAIKNKEIELRREMEAAEVEALIASEIKKRRDAAEQYEKGGRAELKEKEEAEVAVLMDYMPEQLAEGKIRELVKETVAEVGASSAKDMGAVMKALMPKVKGKADGGLVNRIVKETLGG